MPVPGGFHIEEINAVELHPWPRLEGWGVYLILDATERVNHCYIAEIDGGKSLAPQKRMFEQLV